MTRLSSFAPGLHAVVIGAGGAIGGAFVDLLAADAQVAHVTALDRTGLDLADPASIRRAAAGLPAPPDLVIVATGMLHAGPLRPEKSLAELSPDALAISFAVNTIGPALVAQAFLPLLPKGRKTLFAALSARVGSISDNRLGGWHAYRASKAALNQLIRTMAIEQTRRNPASLVVGLHPGTVDSRLSRPFQRGVATLFTPADSAAYLLAVIDRLTPADSGQLFDWRGDVITP